jgi:hypothetical protein
MLSWAHEDVPMDEALIFMVFDDDYPEVDPTTVSTAPGNMNEVTSKLYFLCSYNMNKVTYKWFDLIVDVCPT